MYLYLSASSGRFVLTSFRTGREVAPYELNDAQLRAIRDDCLVGNKDILERLEKHMDKGDRSKWLYIWIDRATGSVMRTKHYPDGTKGQHHQGYFAEFVPPFIHESTDATVRKFLERPGKAGPTGSHPMPNASTPKVAQASKAKQSKGQNKKFDFGDLLDVDDLFADVDEDEGANDIDSLFD